MVEPVTWKTFKASDWATFTAADWEIFRANPAPEPGETASVVCGRLTVLPAAAVSVALGCQAVGRLRSMPAAAGRITCRAGAVGRLRSQPAAQVTVEMLRC